MKPIARLADLHSCPKKGSGTTPAVSVASDPEADGQRVATVGEKNRPWRYHHSRFVAHGYGR